MYVHRRYTYMRTHVQYMTRSSQCLTLLVYAHRWSQNMPPLNIHLLHIVIQVTDPHFSLHHLVYIKAFLFTNRLGAGGKDVPHLFTVTVRLRPSHKPNPMFNSWPGHAISQSPLPFLFLKYQFVGIHRPQTPYTTDLVGEVISCLFLGQTLISTVSPYT